MKAPHLLARCGSVALLALNGALLVAGSAHAQPAPADPRPLGPPPVPAATPRPAPPLPPAAPDVLAIGLAPQPGGLTPDEAGKTASKTKRSVRTKQAELQAAAARVDQAFVNFFPRVSLSATYTRLSSVPGFSLGSANGGLVGAANTGLLKVGACPAPSTDANCVVDSKGQPAAVASVNIPPVLNSTSFVASLAVPISDYLLRISQGYASAIHAEKGKKLEVLAEELQAAGDAKIAYFNWVQAKGQVIVTKQAVDQAKAHLEDAGKAFNVGLISRADVLRLEAQVAAAQQVQAQAEAFSLLAEEQLRTVLVMPAGQPLTIGVDVMHEQPAPLGEALDALQEQAMQRRLEIRALDETQLALKETVSLAKAGYAPRLDAFADAIYANPNQRVFPVRDEFKFTWDLGLRLSWTINDTFAAAGATAEAKARVATLAEQKGALRDGLRLEVASAFADMQKAAVTIEAADRQLVAAEESLRVRNELFRNGKATSTDLVDAEAEATRARLSRLNARIGVLVARVRLEHATGRDVPQRLLDQ